jgi:protein-tyrosine phosphatase
MITYTWWIDEPRLLASSNPNDEDLAQLRAKGFSVAVSFLEEEKQPPRYSKNAAEPAGWSIYSTPIEEGGTPPLNEVCKVTALVRALLEETKVLVHCESGVGRSAFMGAAYWIAKGLTASEAIARVRQAGVKADWNTQERETLLHEYAALLRDARNRTTDPNTIPSFISFIPKPLEIEGRPELQIFPLNVLFAAMTVRDGRVVLARALYEPDISSFLKNDNKGSLLYRNSYGGDGQVKITFDATRRIYYGEKFVNGACSVRSFGTEWDAFFSHFTMLGLTKGEACLFEG